MRTLLRGSLAVLLTVAVAARAQAQATAPGAIVIGRTDTLWSAALKEQRPYQVYTPPGYIQSPYLPRAYPVLYLLDGDAHFHSVTGLLQFFSTGVNGNVVLPEMIVVSIPNTDRTRDLTPTNAAAGPDGKPVAAFKTSGGMPKFLQFVKSELIPHIDSTYRTSPYRVFVGHSFGGIAVINALYTMPETFNAYVAIDPSLWWDQQVLLKKAASYFSKPAVSGRALYVGQANTLEPRKDPKDTNEHFKSIVQFNKVVETGNKSGIRYGYKYYPSDDHGSVPLIAEYDALRFIFDGYKLDAQASVEHPERIAQHFANVSTRLGYTVPPPEKQVDRLGGGAPPEKAVVIMQLNADNYPKSPHAFQSLGNALLSARDTARARAAFRQSLSLDPTNSRVKALVDKLPPL